MEKKAPGPGVRCTGPEEELAPGVSLRARGTTVSPSAGSNVGGEGMTSESKREVLLKRNSQIMIEGHRRYATTESERL